MTVCILGNSKIFIDLVRKIFPNETTKIVGWRASEKPCETFDLVFLCGFDHSIYAKNFKDSVYDGYFSQYLYVRKLKKINKNLLIVYVNTATKSKRVVSRYDFVKNRLAYKLSKLSNYHQLSPKFIVNIDGKPFNPKGAVHSLGFEIFRALGVVETCNPVDLEAELRMIFTGPKNASPPALGWQFQPVCMRRPRGFLIDKIIKTIFLLLKL